MCARAITSSASILEALIGTISIQSFAGKSHFRGTTSSPTTADNPGMVGPFLWLFLNGIGVCVENAFIPTSHLPDDFVSYKWWMPSKTQESDDFRKRSKRLIVPRQDAIVPFPDLTKSFEVPTPTPQASQKPRRKGSRNSKKKGLGVGKEESSKIHKSVAATERKLKKQGKVKKTNTELFRQGQSPRRLRQHMQHKKKVKQFLQKRIQEQIQQRNQNPTVYT